MRPSNALLFLVGRCAFRKVEALPRLCRHDAPALSHQINDDAQCCEQVQLFGQLGLVRRSQRALRQVARNSLISSEVTKAPPLPFCLAWMAAHLSLNTGKSVFSVGLSVTDSDIAAQSRNAVSTLLHASLNRSAISLSFF